MGYPTGGYHEPIAYTGGGAAYCPPCAVVKWGRCQRDPDGNVIEEPAEACAVCREAPATHADGTPREPRQHRWGPVGHDYVIGEPRRCGTIACPHGYPEGHDVPGAVFPWDSDSWAHGGLACDDCGGEIIADAYCHDCDQPLTMHAQYTGPDGKPYGELYCDGDYCEARIRVIVAPRFPDLAGVTTGEDLVPFARPDGDPLAPDIDGTISADEALDSIMAAYAGKVATFQLLGVAS